MAATRLHGGQASSTQVFPSKKRREFKQIPTPAPSPHPPWPSVVNPHHFDAGPDADPDSTYPPDADQDSDLYLMQIRMRIRIFYLRRMRIWIQLFTLMRILILASKKRLEKKGAKIDSFPHILACLLQTDDPVLNPAYHFDADPDADPDFYLMRIRILLAADADPGYQNDANPCESGSTTM